MLPQEFMESTYEKSRSRRYADVAIVAEHAGHVRRWPGPHQHVHTWWTLPNGMAVGWNESPSHGWSFPVVRAPAA